MEEKVLLGRDQQIIEFPESVWKQPLTQIPQHSQDRLSFMTDKHHQVRYFAVRELVDGGMPITPEVISERLNLPLTEVKVILDELERKLFFLVRDAQGAVTWAYPMTVEPTPHRLNFSTGEQLYSA